MKILLVLLAAAMLASLPAPMALYAEETISRPEWSVGDWWENSQYRFTVTARKDDKYEVLRTPKGKAADPAGGWDAKLSVTPDFWTSERVDADGKVTRFTDETWYQWVRFPLSVGKRWSFVVLSRDKSDGSSRRYEHDCAAARWEEVEVSGRSVRTLRIECKSSIRGSPSSGWFHTAWYAPEAKRLVRLTSQYSGGPTQDWVGWSVQP